MNTPYPATFSYPSASTPDPELTVILIPSSYVPLNLSNDDLSFQAPNPVAYYPVNFMHRV